MNIDVREYLRINPISVHELTLSEDGIDCFLWFGQNDAGEKPNYYVHTQNVIFYLLCKTIFGDLIKGTGYDDMELQGRLVEDEHGNIQISWLDRDGHKIGTVTDPRFFDYKKRAEWEPVKTYLYTQLSDLISQM